MGKHITVSFGFPSPTVLEALGRLVVMQGHLEHILKLTFKSFSNIPLVEALNQTKRSPSKILRKKIMKLIKEMPIGKNEQGQISNLIDRSWKASLKRNQFVHNVWGRVNIESNNLLLQNDDLSWRKAPSKKEIDGISNEVSSILVLLDEFRKKISSKNSA